VGATCAVALREFHAAVVSRTIGITSVITVAVAYRKRAADGGVIVLTTHITSASREPCHKK
jgi:hypothetical protein